MTGFEDETDSDHINILPDELIISIFRFLPVESILACEQVCHRWRKLALDAALWRRFVIIYSGKPGQSEISEKNLEIISSHAEYIHCLKVQYVYSYPFINTMLQKCSNIVSLELVMCRIGIEFEEDIKKWKYLKKLNLKNSLLLTSDADLTIQYDIFLDLNYLALSDFGLNPNNCDSLLRCAHLSHIFIEKIKDLNLDFVKMLILSKQNILVTLHIYGGQSVDDECLDLLAKCPQLEDLAIIRCERLTDKGVIALAHLKRIEHLQIWNNVNFSEIALLSTLRSPKLVNLQSLSLSRIGNISPMIVDIISEYYKNLKFLAVYQCPRIINTDYEKQLKSKFRNIDVVLY